MERIGGKSASDAAQRVRPVGLVPPEALARLSNLNLIARWIVEGFISGLHRSPYHGFSVEFAEYRPYAVGDDLRYFDWKALGKSDRHYVKKFHSETNLRAHILLDCSASMAFGDPITKLRYGTVIAAALSYLMALQQDAVGVILFADRVIKYLPPKATMRNFHDISAVLQNAQPQSTTNMSNALHYLAETVKRKSLFIIISDFYDETDQILKGFRHLRFNKHELIAFHLVNPNEAEFPYRQLAAFKDLENGERVEVSPLAYRPAYLEAFKAFLKTMRQQCSNMLIDYQMVDTAMPFDRILAQYLFRRRRLG